MPWTAGLTGAPGLATISGLSMNGWGRLAVIVRVKGIKRVRSKGRLYYYHRATGTRIMAPPRSAAFIAEVHRLDAAPITVRAATPRHEARPAPHKAGSWGALVAAYRASPEFARLAPRTKRDYGGVLDYLAALDDMPLVQLTSAACFKIRDKAFTQRKRRFANYVTHMLSVVLGWGKPRGYVGENAAFGLPKIAKPRDGPEANRAWSDDEADAVLAAATGGLKVAVALAMWAGPRGEDVVRMPWSASTGRTSSGVRARRATPCGCPPITGSGKFSTQRRVWRQPSSRARQGGRGSPPRCGKSFGR